MSKVTPGTLSRRTTSTSCRLAPGGSRFSFDNLFDSRYNSPVAPREKFHVLFVCIGNSCRSPMAEAVARQLASDIIEPSSAGLAPLGHIAERTIATLSANGHSAGGLFSKRLSPKAIDDADLIVNLSGLAIDCLPGRVKVEEWPVEDPYGAGPATYQRILEEIEGRVLTLAARLRSQPKLKRSHHL
jgi:arsenate reductase